MLNQVWFKPKACKHPTNNQDNDINTRFML